ncbi:hypothetical protein ISS07_03355 [Candidatus Woesearchaeota archaeon]|nr:hypothetical protein [Candidatus Woesearchaeota archaeon]
MEWLRNLLGSSKDSKDFANIKELLVYIQKILNEYGAYPTHVATLFDNILGENGTIALEKISVEKYEEAISLMNHNTPTLVIEDIPSKIKKLKKEAQSILQTAEKNELSTLNSIKTTIRQIVKVRKKRNELMDLCDVCRVLSKEHYKKANTKINSLTV